MTTQLDFSAISKPKDAVAQEEKVPFLRDMIKSLKDGIYPIYRAAWLFQYNYFVLESHRFRLNVKKALEPELCAELEECFHKEKAIGILIQGMEYVIISPNWQGTWDQIPGDKATSWMFEGRLPEFVLLPEDKKIKDEEIAF